MNENERSALVRSGWAIHGAVEAAYLAHPPADRETDPEAWRERQRLLLADMAVHLLQTALRPGAIEPDQLKHNLHAILTIADAFLPHAGLKAASGKLYSDS
ncbi:hypothetical protein [Massilia sp. Leaf139]|uniref:hypothetical protein n=1 Tax=Massilia sp. Leaf139 TaxID=1736272 RepID=UPI0006F35755|nr:hypothetical protein [Massilia sp. Leaf139]KQQ96487.1 hypothetical protein ASF77_00315 [Massilia sp. Leaf139]